MQKKSHSVKVHVEKFFVLLKNYPDSTDSTLVFVRFLRSFLRGSSQPEILPAIEIMTLLKEQKPAVFYSMRKLAERDELLAFLTGLSMNPEKAERKLQEIYESPES
ncbi:hypothetical protein [Domibacillus robiginosus]|uniref:hypothetical protein n=1 Tax=Domibacillus robiginosus TaxID=1071054 RepID=UPI00067CEB52|nr:hypothetical protein [Domibacillus robiginosus]